MQRALLQPLLRCRCGPVLGTEWYAALLGPQGRCPCRGGAPTGRTRLRAAASSLCGASTFATRPLAPRLPTHLRRHVLVLDSQGQQLRRLGPLPAPVQHVCWPGGDAAVGLLLAATPSGLHCWRDGGAAEGCQLLAPSGEQPPPQEQQRAYACIAAALGAPLVAASCTATNEVRAVAARGGKAAADA